MTEIPTVDCRSVEEQLEPLLDGELEARTAEAVRGHVGQCDSCSAAFRLATEIQAKLRSLPTMDLPAERLRAIKAVASKRGAWWWGRVGWWPSPAGLAAAATVLALVTILVLLWVPGGDRRRTALEEIALDEQPAGASAVELGRTPTRDEIDRAAAEARFALSYLNRLAGRAGLEVRDEVFDRNLVRPTTRELHRGLEPLRGEERRAKGSAAVGSTA